MPPKSTGIPSVVISPELRGILFIYLFIFIFDFILNLNLFFFPLGSLLLVLPREDGPPGLLDAWVTPVLLPSSLLLPLLPTLFLK